MSEATLEQRMTVLEQTVRNLQDALCARTPAPDWLEQVIGSMKDEPAFDTAEMLYIHPDECIDCGACVPACPVEAIFALDETPQRWDAFIGKNADYYRDRAEG